MGIAQGFDKYGVWHTRTLQAPKMQQALGIKVSASGSPPLTAASVHQSCIMIHERLQLTGEADENNAQATCAAVLIAVHVGPTKWQSRTPPWCPNWLFKGGPHF